MRLDEAKVILEENGYELLDEGKLGRALGIGALALGSLIGHGNAAELKDPPNLRNYTEEQLQDFVENFDNEEENNIHYKGYKIKDKTIIFSFVNSIHFYPTKHINGLSDNIVHIVLTLNNSYLGIKYKDGSIETFEYEKGKNNPIYTKYDDLDKIEMTKSISNEKMNKICNTYYNLLVKN